MIDGIGWFFQNLALAFYNFFYAISNPGSWLAWLNGIGTEEAKQSLMRFIYYGGSVEFFFVIFVAFLVLTALGMWRNRIMWHAVCLNPGDDERGSAMNTVCDKIQELKELKELRRT